VKALLAGATMVGLAAVIGRRRGEGLGLTTDSHYSEAKIAFDEAEKRLDQALELVKNGECSQAEKKWRNAIAFNRMGVAHAQSMRRSVASEELNDEIEDRAEALMKVFYKLDSEFGSSCAIVPIAKSGSIAPSQRGSDVDILFGPSPFKPWKPGDPL
jgi:hypothetical protein